MPQGPACQAVVRHLGDEDALGRLVWIGCSTLDQSLFSRLLDLLVALLHVGGDALHAALHGLGLLRLAHAVLEQALQQALPEVSCSCISEGRRVCVCVPGGGGRGRCSSGWIIEPI